MSPRDHKQQTPLRVLTATAIFDGHDVAINMIRRLLQDRGVEVIHLGHNRSVKEVVSAARQEAVDAIAISSYQGGHREYFHYLIDQLVTDQIAIFGGGGGTISAAEARALEAYGVNRIYTAEDGASLGLAGMADDLIARCHTARQQQLRHPMPDLATSWDDATLGQQLSLLEQGETLFALANDEHANSRIIGVTGTGGAGKSTLIDEMINAVLLADPSLRIALLAIDPTRQKTGGALLGDRIRINSQPHPRLFIHSLATRRDNVSISPVLKSAIALLVSQGFGLVLIETAGIGQSDAAIVELVDSSIYVMTQDYGAPSQLEKIEMLDVAAMIVLNKADQRGSDDALRSIRKQWRINHWENKYQENKHQKFSLPDEDIPVYPVVASRFNDAGLQQFLRAFLSSLSLQPAAMVAGQTSTALIPNERSHYLAEISRQARGLKQHQQLQCAWVHQLQSLQQTLEQLQGVSREIVSYNKHELAQGDQSLKKLKQQFNDCLQKVDSESISLLQQWPAQKETLKLPCETSKSLSGLSIPKIAVPEFNDWGTQLTFLLAENLPGNFPYTAGVFPHRHSEEPTRMFAGAGTPEDTNRRFFYLLQGQSSIRLSTAFDPIVLYGKEPALQPDIYGCIGMSGVSVASLDDMKKLYSGIDLLAPNTSVSLTINGPAAIVLAWFFHAAIDQQIEKYCQAQGQWPDFEKKIAELHCDKKPPQYHGELPAGHHGLGLALLGVNGSDLVDAQTYQRIASETLQQLRGTLQADILKEELAQNECIFSLEFGLQLMADMQRYFIDRKIKRFYGVSVSGYHIAEAGANPITQLAFTLANGFTLLEYYLAQGMAVDDFAGQFSFFFSNGMEPEYAVIGRVARRIWARAMRYVYGANSRSQKLKYHIQTSGRSLHAQAIELNDIRTTLQALYAVYDNCNSLHTNAYDEAVTTPTEASVRRAQAIQLIITRELGMNRNQNPLQGAFIIEQLTDLVEEAVYQEFDRLSHRGGVLGALETFYQRNVIQEQSLHYEQKKNDGSLPIIGVNTFLQTGEENGTEAIELIRCSDQQKRQQVDSLQRFQAKYRDQSAAALKQLLQHISAGGNSFEGLMTAAKVCSLAQLTQALMVVGGAYRRKM